MSKITMVADYKSTTCILSNQPGLRCHGETFLWVVYVKGIQILLLNTDLNPEDGTSENERLVVYPKKRFHQFIDSFYWIDIIIFNRVVYFSVWGVKILPNNMEGGKKNEFQIQYTCPWFLINLHICCEPFILAILALTCSLFTIKAERSFFFKCSVF